MTDVIDNRYQLLESIGEGGMGKVIKAWDQRLERYVAIKRLHLVGRAEDIAEFRNRFEREAKAMARLQHPNIVRVHDFGQDEDGVYLVMDYLPNGTLKDQMTRVMSPQRAASLLIPIAEALQYIHERGVIHRDVKPANILFDERGQPRLGDFGVIKMIGGDVTNMTQAGYAVGTPAYMAPELIEGDVLPQSDQYALGVIFYELITGKKPFEGKTPMETMLMHKTRSLPDPRMYAPNLSQNVLNVILRSLAKEPFQRFENLHEFSEALKRIQQASVPAAQPQQVMSPAPQPQHQSPRQSPPEAASPAEEKVAWLPIVIIAISAVLIIALVGTIIWTVLSDSVRTTQSANMENYLTQTSAVQLTEAALEPSVEVVTETPTETPEGTGTPEMTETPQPTETIQPTEEIPTATNTPEPTLAPTEVMVRVRGVDGMPMVSIPAGAFQMGRTDQQLTWNTQQEWCDSSCTVDLWASEQPVHTVTLDTYWIDQYEVSNVQYAACEAAGVCQSPLEGRSLSRDNYYATDAFADYPVVYVSWQDARNYCAWAGGRLPTEAEWEKAARGTSGGLYPWGDTLPNESLANYGKFVADTSRVGKYPAGVSEYEVFDLAGNVWEWVSDYWDANYYQSSPSTNPTGPETGTNRIIRGGAFHNTGGDIRSALRLEYPPEEQRYFIGFRCVVPGP